MTPKDTKYQDVETSKRGKQCWCGEKSLRPFSPAYRLCPNCSTLVLINWPDESTFIVDDDASAFYGKHYFTTHVSDAYGQISLDERARRDLAERCLYWLKTLLKYKTPPASLLELGASHGGFVALCSWAGFASTGLEMSPWLVEYAKATFGVPMLTGPIEVQNVKEESLDVIALMDVIEHLPTPLSTMRRCLSLLKRDGILLIQTPGYHEGLSYEAIIEGKDRFAEQFKVQEHLYLFSEKSVRMFFEGLGAKTVIFERAYYDFYDMFFIVGKSGITQIPEERSRALLGDSPSGKLVHAILEVDRREEICQAKLQVAENDRNARLAIIEEQGRRLGMVEGEVNSLRQLLQEKQSQIQSLEDDGSARLRLIEDLGNRRGELEGERNRLKSLLEAAELQLKQLELDHASRLQVINTQGSRLGELEAERNVLAQLHREKEEQLRQNEADREARLKVIEDQGLKLGQLENERNVLKVNLDDKVDQLRQSEVDRADRLRIIQELGEHLGKVEGERNRMQFRIEELEIQFKQSEEDRAARLRVIEDQGSRLVRINEEIQKFRREHADLQRLVLGMTEQISILRGQLNTLQSALQVAETSLPMRLFASFGTKQKIARTIEAGFEKAHLPSGHAPLNPDDRKA